MQKFWCVKASVYKSYRDGGSLPLNLFIFALHARTGPSRLLQCMLSLNYNSHTVVSCFRFPRLFPACVAAKVWCASCVSILDASSQHRLASRDRENHCCLWHPKSQKWDEHLANLKFHDLVFVLLKPSNLCRWSSCSRLLRPYGRDM